ncbi:endonuclease domain-containing protein [Microbacterium sp. LRZ72]|uniref:endonuclease domain-containing protein n=1 Tax=Microbacterium sp. LRZ72 TaxID=2942481 RepID=UPI0029BCD43A|nr:DUF559 domain-containing protein [Microbacterium sp. LRZ72]MDX2377808.1 endonuclease domain-containing protein [Microbacterium sp. LRZ72]
MQRSELPGHLGRAFSVAGAREAGVPPSRLRARDLDRPFFGVRAASGERAGRVEERVCERARQYAVRMPAGVFFTHLTAAVLWGVPLPHAMITDVLDVGVFSPGRGPRGRGVRGHEVSPALASATTHAQYSLPVASPATTWAMLGAELPHPYDLVAAGDHLIRVPRMPGGYQRPQRPAYARIEQLAAAVAAGRRPGIRALRAALPRLRTGAASRRETWLRLSLVDAGLPEPVLDHDVLDELGRFVACVDLAYPELKIAIEYDGEHHRTDARQWAADIDRLDRLAEEGWRVVRATNRHIFAMPGVVVQRVRTAREVRARSERRFIRRRLRVRMHPTREVRRMKERGRAEAPSSVTRCGCGCR